MFKIFIIMFMFSPDPEGFDSISVEYIDDKLLRFKTKELCVSHVHDNLEVLKERVIQSKKKKKKFVKPLTDFMLVSDEEDN